MAQVALWCAAAASAGAAAGEIASPPRVATFQCDMTPPAGEPVIWNVPVVTVLDTLWAKGIVIEQDGDRFVLCALDWCELCNDADLRMRQAIARAARTTADRVAIHTVHQHAAPYADDRAHAYLDRTVPPVLRLSDAFLARSTERLAQAVAESTKQLSEFDRLGMGQAKVDRVASSRRLRQPDGSILVRFSGGGSNPKLAEAPEGTIDPYLKTLTLARGERPLVRLHFYATHPQTFACDGRASSDFAGLAREDLQRSENIPQVYFTGCAGDTTVGKYNDGTDAARSALRQRLLAGMRNSIAATKWEPAGRVQWRSTELKLAPRPEPAFSRESLLARVNDPKASPGARVYQGAIVLAFLDRIERPLSVSCLQVGSASMVLLPGEPMLEFQRYAQGLRPSGFVAVAGYFDCGPGYICTDEALREGGYEPTDSNVAPGSEAKLKGAIREVLAPNTTGQSGPGGPP